MWDGLVPLRGGRLLLCEPRELGLGCLPLGLVLGLAEAQGTLADLTSLQAKELGWALATSCRVGMGSEQEAGMLWE